MVLYSSRARSETRLSLSSTAKRNPRVFNVVIQLKKRNLCG